jgi:methionyl-tRNA formyltransferase
MDYKDLRIVYMGTPEFAAIILKTLVEEKLNIVGVITAPDKPAGRGQKMQESEVKKYASSQKLKILQPEKLKNTEFLRDLESLKADVQVVVAFRMLPESVWKMPPKGTFNLHASLLPHYRGAAPINWAIINGEKKTGLTTFFIDNEIDTGKVLLQSEIEIDNCDTAGQLHDKMIPVGARLIIETLKVISDGNYQAIPQEILSDEHERIKPAPKLFKENCRINWEQEGKNIYNFIRGLSPYPCAWTELSKQGEEKASLVKIFDNEFVIRYHNEQVGTLIQEGTKLYIAVKDGIIQIKSLQLEGKKRMQTEDFLRGHKINGHFVR